MATGLEIRGKENEKALKIILEFERKGGSHGILTGCLNIKVLPILVFNLMVSVSIKMLHHKVLENSLRSERSQGKVRKSQSQAKWPPYDIMNVALV